MRYFLSVGCGDNFRLLGDDDGFCESNKACIYSPNIGSYQGHGELLESQFSQAGGLVQGVKMYGYPNNGRAIQ